MARVLDGRRDGSGEYRQSMIDWFVEHGIETGLVLVDTVMVTKTPKGKYKVRWSEVRRSGDYYVTDTRGKLRSWVNSKVVTGRPYWVEER